MSKWEVKVRTITDVSPHENADRLEVARVDGFDWDIIVGKGQFKVGNLAIYVPVDSILPQDILDTVFKDSKVQPSKGRIKTARIRQKVSYGLLLSPELLSGRKNQKDKTIHLIDVKDGMDVDEILGIVKYEPPEPAYSTRSMGMKKQKLNPYFREYVDVENIKYYPNTFGYPDAEGNDVEVVVCEKVHGTNFRFGKLKKRMDNWFSRAWGKLTGEYEYVVGSRRVQQKTFGTGKTWLEQRGVVSENVYTHMAKKLKFKEWMPENYVVYGEIYGKGIQDMEYGLTDYDFIAFDVMYIDGETERYLDYDEFKEFCLMYGLNRVPELYRGKWSQDCLNYRTGTTTVGNNLAQIKEGVVIKTVKETTNSLLGRVILKVINEEYLLREKGTEFH